MRHPAPSSVARLLIAAPRGMRAELHRPQRTCAGADVSKLRYRAKMARAFWLPSSSNTIQAGKDYSYGVHGQSMTRVRVHRCTAAPSVARRISGGPSVTALQTEAPPERPEDSGWPHSVPIAEIAQQALEPDACPCTALGEASPKTIAEGGEHAAAT